MPVKLHSAFHQPSFTPRPPSNLSLHGTAIDTEDALAFSVLENIRPTIETLPLDQAPEAYARMMQGKARFRMVLTTSAAA